MQELFENKQKRQAKSRNIGRHRVGRGPGQAPDDSDMAGTGPTQVQFGHPTVLQNTKNCTVFYMIFAIPGLGFGVLVAMGAWGVTC